MLAIGRFYDDRLQYEGFNISILLSSIYCIITYYIVFLFGRHELNKAKIFQYIFFVFVIISNLMLWIIYGLNDYGLSKFLDFVLITMPISIVISQVFKNKDIKYLLYVIFGVSIFLLFISLINVSDLILERQGVLGGGPIVLSRWLGIGALISFFYKPIKRYRLVLFPAFIVMALLTGSRGPIAAIFIVMLIHFFFNFKRLFLKTLLVLSLVIIAIFASGIHNQFLEIKTVSRVFMNMSEGGLAQSTEGRSILIQSSFEQIFKHPMGVGFGNWQDFSHLRSYFLTKDLFYPHNVFLEIFCELGVLVGIIFVIYVLIIFFYSFTLFIRNKNDLFQVLFYIFAFLMFNSMISGDFSDARMLFVFMSLISIKGLNYVNNL